VFIFLFLILPLLPDLFYGVPDITQMRNEFDPARYTAREL
jgi:hypothetical protein